jgi:CheY-like chemotaxis protein
MAEATTSAITLLLVAKNPADVCLLQALLSEIALPAQLTAVYGGEQALGVLRHVETSAQTPVPDVLFLDTDLPQGEVFSLLDAIASSPVLSAMAVVVYSGTGQSKDHVLAAGLVAAYLTRVLDREQYMGLLEKLLRQP